MSLPRRRARAASAIALAALLALAGAPHAHGERSLYDWTAVAPTVVAGRSLGENGKYVEFVVSRVLRGELEAGDTIRLDVRHANAERDRETHRRGLRLEEGVEYLVLLRPAPSRSRKREPRLPTFDLVRGVLGARELPAEGAAPVLDGLATLIEVQDLDLDSARWQRLTELLEGTNPVVLENVLQQFVKFRRGSSGDLPALRPLLDHPSPTVRRRTARLIGLLVGRVRSAAEVDLPAIQADLVSRARSDADVEVRVAATRALDGLDAPEIDRILGEIAQADPDQDVRYAAERLLYERSLRSADGGSAN